MLIKGFAPLIPLRTGFKPVALDYSAISANANNRIRICDTSEVRILNLLFDLSTIFAICYHISLTGFEPVTTKSTAWHHSQMIPMSLWDFHPPWRIVYSHNTFGLDYSSRRIRTFVIGLLLPLFFPILYCYNSSRPSRAA